MISILIIIALVFLLIGSFTDIKSLEVPDWVSYTMIAAGIIVNALLSLFANDWTYIIQSSLGLILTIIIGVVMYYSGQWGGGDSKVLFGMGAILGFSFPVTPENIFSDMLLKFMVNMLFAGALYGITWIIVMAVKNWKKVSKKISISLEKMQKLRLMSGIAAVVIMLAVFFLPFFDYGAKAVIAAFLMIIYFMNYLYAIVKAVEETAMIHMIDPEKLTEGDWIVDDIKIGKEYISGPKDLGITKEKIARLLELKKKGKITKVKVKYGIPFVPSFLIAMIFTAITDKIVLLMFL